MSLNVLETAEGFPTLFAFIGLHSGVGFHVFEGEDHLKASSQLLHSYCSFCHLTLTWHTGTDWCDALRKGWGTKGQFSADTAITKCIPGWNFWFTAKSLCCPYHLHIEGKGLTTTGSVNSFMFLKEWESSKEDVQGCSWGLGSRCFSAQ